MIKPLTLLIALAVLSFGSTYAQTFEKIIIDDESGVYNGECRWFDVDNDNDLDFIITGQVETNTLRTVVFENLGDDEFEEMYSSQGFSETGLEFLNLNQDEDVDFVLMGRSIGVDNDLQTYQNNDGSIVIVDNTIPEFLTGGSNGTLVYADINNDFYPDIFITGINGYVEAEANVEAHFYVQSYDQSYSISSSLENPVYLADANIFDADGDHDLDLFVSGNDNVFPYQRTELYLNENGSFILDENNTFVQLQNASIDIGDFDNDSDSDIIITGLDESSDPATILYKNTEGIFSVVEDTDLNDRNGSAGSVMWGDFDNDGDLDLLLGGESDGDYDFEIMVNQGDDLFEHLDENNFLNLAYGAVAWGDYDGDGDLDILATGYEGNDDPKIVIYKNNLQITSVSPAMPSDLTATYEDETVTLSWNAELNSRSHSGNNNLTYNINVESIDGDQLLYGFSDLNTGYRKIVDLGNVGYSNDWTFRNLETGTYVWHVQAIDPAYLPSVFSESSYIYVGIPESAPILISVEVEAQGISLKWQDTNVNEEYFIIERKVTNEEGFVKIDSTGFDVVDFVDRGSELPPSFSASYRILASNPSGESDYSEQVQVWHNGKPTDLLVEQLGTGVALTWEDNSINEDYFIIERKAAGEEAFAIIDSVNTDITVYIDTNKSDGYTAFYRVFAANAYGTTDYSKEEGITVLEVRNAMKDEWHVFPNPVQDQISVMLDSRELGNVIRLISQTGKLILHQTINSTSLVLFLGDLPQGIYYLAIPGQPVKKVIKR